MIYPMLAHPFISGRMEFPAILQPKVNGGRTISTATMDFGKMFDPISILIQGKEKIYYDVPHIEEELRKLYTVIDVNTILDGELYKHGYKSTAIVGAGRNRSNPLNKQLTICLFDLVNNNSQILRMNELIKIGVVINNLGLKYVSVLPHYTVNSEDEAIELSRVLYNEGWEGGILRSFDNAYIQGKRVKTMLKIKFKIIIQAVITDFEYKTHPIFICTTNDKKTKDISFRADGVREYLNLTPLECTQLIGKNATVECFELTNLGKPFHSTIINIY